MGSFFGFLAVLLFIVGHSQVKILDHFPVYQVVLIRALGVLMFSLPYLLVKKIPVAGVDKQNLILRGVFGSTALFTYFTTLQNLPLANAVLLQQLAPIFALIFANFILKEKSSLKIYLLFVLSLFGVFLIKDPESSWSIYYLFGAGSAAFAAIAYNFVRKLKATDHPMVVLTYFQYILVPMALVGFFIYGYVPVTTDDLIPMFFLALFSFLAQLCLTLAYHKTVVSKASGFNFLAIPLSAIVGVVFFNEVLSGTQLLGIAIVFATITVNTLYGSQLFRKRTL